MYNIAICDDMPEICTQIESYIKEFTIENLENFSIYKTNGANELYKLLKNIEIDLLFLDIEMPDINGIEIGNYIRKKIKDDDMQIVYVSGKEDYYLELFDVRPMHFLKKPFTKNDIYKELREWLRLTRKNLPTFTYTIGKDAYFQKIDEIIYFEIAGKKVKMVTKGFETNFYSNIEKIEEELSKYYFVSVHKSYVINMEKIKKYGSKEVIMDGDKKISISRSKKDDFLEKMLKFEETKLFTKL